MQPLEKQAEFEPFLQALQKEHPALALIRSSAMFPYKCGNLVLGLELFREKPAALEKE
jgi:hydrogenase maturation factor HypF (carbamoyltransferase family)